MSEFKSIDERDALKASERAVLSAILRNGPVARSDVTQLTDLSQQSVHRIIDTLENQGFLRFQEPEIRGRGKPSPRVAIDPHHYATVGISIGTEEIRVCAMDLAGQPIVEDVLAASPDDPRQVLDRFEAKITSWMTTRVEQSRLLGIGVAMQGYRIGRQDIFYPPTPLAPWSEFSLAGLFGERLELPAFSENNATSSATAEHYLGVGSAHKCLAYLSFNYGFGAGMFFDGDAYLGGHGNAGEISSIYAPDQARIRPALGELVKRISDTSGRNLSVQELIANFDPTLAVVAQWLDDVTPQLCLALRALKAVADPNVIVFGGEAPESLRAMLIDRAADAFDPKMSPSPALVPGKIPSDPAHLGAALLPLHKLIY